MFASSYLVYDPALYLFDEPQAAPDAARRAAPLRPRNLCGSAKLMHEQELEFLALFPGTPFTLGLGADLPRLRPRLAGRRLALGPLADRRPRGSARGVPRRGLVRLRLRRRRRRGLLRLGAGDATGVVNLGSGRARRVSELLDILAARFPGAAWLEEPADIPFEAHEADLARLEQITGWRPPTTLEQGVEILAEHELAAAAAA